MLGGYYLGQLYLGISGLPSAGTIVVLPSSHQLSSDNILLTQKHHILLDNTTHALMSSNVVLTQKHLLTVENSIHSLMGENAAITSEHFLGINDSFHGLQSTEIQLTQKHDILVDSSNHGLSSGIVDLIEHKTIVVQNTTHGHTANGNLVIPVKFYLVVNNTTHGFTSSVITLTQRHSLSINNTTHSLTSTSIGGLINLEPFGFGGGFGAIDGLGTWGVINTELPLNYLAIAANVSHTLYDSLQNILQDYLLLVNDSSITVTITSPVVWEFGMRFGGTYIRDFNDDGAVGGEYTADTGVVGVKSINFGKVSPEEIQNLGFFTLETGSNGSYSQNDTTSGFILLRHLDNGLFNQDSYDTGTYTKENTNSGEYEV